MGMCAFTFCTPCWCAAGFGTAAGPLCCCKNWYLNSKARRVQVVGGALAVTLGLCLYIFMRVACMEKGECTTECSRDSGSGEELNCTTTCQDAPFRLWESSGCEWSTADFGHFYTGALAALLLGLGTPQLIVALTCARSLQPDPLVTADGVAVTVPAGAHSGSLIEVVIDGQRMQVEVPAGVSAGQQFFVRASPKATAVATAVAAPPPQNMSAEMP